ncbi:hypothetical protein PanWU01x14_272170 [Parasponia andersonii]|uniref:Uncharacterized protein n=1 Tax=Parasponia andersonii TaxID=3476 RepID=A0A2P5B4G9_PARAD|nr:hypothetical protein PanWU01x14_272170 [Parasponia andersonii]
MRRERVSSEHVGRRGRKRRRNELERVEFGASKVRILTPIAPNFSYRSMSLIGAPSAAAATSAAAAAARVMTRRMARELSMVGGFLEVKKEPAPVLVFPASVRPVQPAREDQVKANVEIKEEQLVAPLVKEEPTEEQNEDKDGEQKEDKDVDEEEGEEEEKAAVVDAEGEGNDGPEEGGVEGGATVAMLEVVMGYDEFEDGLIDWNSWSFEQEDRAWWGSWSWDWIWYPYSDMIDNGVNWASYSVDNEEASWEFGIWNRE